MSITLPPINIGTAVLSPTAGLRLVADIDIRARDIEVAGVALEAAAKVCEIANVGASYRIRDSLAGRIRALEIKHD